MIPLTNTGFVASLRGIPVPWTLHRCNTLLQTYCMDTYKVVLTLKMSGRLAWCPYKSCKCSRKGNGSRINFTAWAEERSADTHTRRCVCESAGHSPSAWWVSFSAWKCALQGTALFPQHRGSAQPPEAGALEVCNGVSQGCRLGYGTKAYQGKYVAFECLQ